MERQHTNKRPQPEVMNKQGDAYEALHGNSDMKGISRLGHVSIHDALNHLAADIHANNRKAGWWDNPREDGTLFMLMVSEISEAMEGARKDLMDDKLPHHKMVDVELADAIIRILDYCGAHDIDIGGIVAEKRAFNIVRPDHQRENRAQENGEEILMAKSQMKLACRAWRKQTRELNWHTGWKGGKKAWKAFCRENADVTVSEMSQGFDFPFDNQAEADDRVWDELQSWGN